MEFKLNKPLSVMNKDAGAYEDCNLVTVSFTGKKGLKALKGIQDIILLTFRSVNSDSASNKGDKVSPNDKDMEVDDLLSLLDITGSSEKVFDAVSEKLAFFATVGTQKLNDQLQNEMDMDDLDGLYQEVLKSFLLPKIIQRLNSLTS